MNKLGENIMKNDNNIKKTVWCVAMRGRNPKRPTCRIAGLPTEQRLEIGPNKGTILTALTTVSKDGLILERIEEKEENDI